jgi:hypothetical protein
MAWNLTTGAVVGALVGGIAWAITRRHHLGAAGAPAPAPPPI